MYFPWILVFLGSIQIITSSVFFVKIVALISVIGCSSIIGAFVRELFILEKDKALSSTSSSKE